MLDEKDRKILELADERATLRARLSALEEHLKEAEVEFLVYYDSGEMVKPWLTRAREILKGE